MAGMAAPMGIGERQSLAYNAATKGNHLSMPETWLFHFRVAIGFLTRLPFGPTETLPPNGLAEAMRAFPLVGIVVGGGVGLVYWAAFGVFGPVIAALLAVAGGIWLTGGLHEDGLADTLDGFGARGERRERLDAMRDSRIGTYGVLALMISLSLRVAALAALAPGKPALAALVAAGALSRAAMPLTMRLLPPARSDGLGFSAGKPLSGTVLTAMGVAALLSLFGLGLSGGMLAILSTVAAVIWLNRVTERHLGGYTGDTLGALQPVIEGVVLLAVVAVG